jgi:hypothetical protein
MDAEVWGWRGRGPVKFLATSDCRSDRQLRGWGFVGLWRPENTNPDMQDEVVGSFEFYAGLAEKLERDGDEDLKVPDETLKILVRKEPLGVCALITPWNYPLLMAVVSCFLLLPAHPFSSLMR